MKKKIIRNIILVVFVSAVMYSLIVSRPKNITIEVDGVTIEHKSTCGNIKEVIDELNINLNKEDKINFCFLIPMEILFEDFVFNFMKEKFNDKYKEITAQKSNLYLAQVMVDDKPLSNVFRLKQDIFLRDLNNNVTILDTKYKLLNKSEDKKYGISQSDMYQMCSYALRGGYNNLALVYPRVDCFHKDIKYRINSAFNEEVIEIKVIIIDFVLDYQSFIKSRSEEFELYEANDNKIKYE